MVSASSRGKIRRGRRTSFLVLYLRTELVVDSSSNPRALRRLHTHRLRNVRGPRCTDYHRDRLLRCRPLLLLSRTRLGGLARISSPLPSRLPSLRSASLRSTSPPSPKLWRLNPYMEIRLQLRPQGAYKSVNPDIINISYYAAHAGSCSTARNSAAYRQRQARPHRVWNCISLNLGSGSHLVCLLITDITGNAFIFLSISSCLSSSCGSCWCPSSHIKCCRLHVRYIQSVVVWRWRNNSGHDACPSALLAVLNAFPHLLFVNEMTSDRMSPQLVAKPKLSAPDAHTLIEIISARWGTFA